MKKIKLDDKQKKTAKKAMLRCSLILQGCFLLGMLLNVDNNSWVVYTIFFALSFVVMILSLEDDYR